MERACKFKEENLERIRLNCRDGVAIQMKSLRDHFQFIGVTSFANCYSLLAFRRLIFCWQIYLGKSFGILHICHRELLIAAVVSTCKWKRGLSAVDGKKFNLLCVIDSCCRSPE